MKKNLIFPCQNLNQQETPQLGILDKGIVRALVSIYICLYWIAHFYLLMLILNFLVLLIWNIITLFSLLLLFWIIFNLNYD